MLSLPHGTDKGIEAQTGQGPAQLTQLSGEAGMI